MAKLRPNEKRVQLSFQREEDLRLFAFMTKKAYKCRWELPTFILAALQDAFGAEMDNEEVDAVAEEALAKVRERKAVPPEPPAPPMPEMPAPPAKPTVKAQMSADEAYEQALKQVQSLNAEPMSPVKPKKDKKEGK